MAWGIPISFYSGGKLECFFIKGTYRLKGDRVICNVMGDEYEFIREGEYLVDRENELDIYSYKVIDTWSSETINGGLADKFVKVLYYQKQ